MRDPLHAQTHFYSTRQGTPVLVFGASMADSKTLEQKPFSKQFQSFPRSVEMFLILHRKIFSLAELFQGSRCV